MRAILALLLAASVAQADSLATVAKDYKADFRAAREKWQGKKLVVEVEIVKRLVHSGNTYYQPAVEELPKSYQFLLKMGGVRLYRPGDKLALTVTLTADAWGTGKLFFDAQLDKEIEVRPPLLTSAQLLAQYLRSPKTAGEVYIGKEIDLQGAILHVADGGVVLECIEHIDLVRNSPTFRQIILDRPITTIRFLDDSIAKAKLTRGVAIEIRGTVEYLKGNRAIIKDAILLK